MNKAEQREVSRLTTYRDMGADAGMLARAVSALVRAAKTQQSKDALTEIASSWGIADHEEYVV